MPSVVVQGNGICLDRPARASLLELKNSRNSQPYRRNAAGERLVTPDLAAAPNAPLRVSLVSMEGIELRVADCRHLYPGENRVSFVFAHFSEYRAWMAPSS